MGSAIDGTSSPIACVRLNVSDRAAAFGIYESSARARVTASRNFARTFPGLLITRETVAGETPARRATSLTPALEENLASSFVITTCLSFMQSLRRNLGLVPQFQRYG